MKSPFIDGMLDRFSLMTRRWWDSRLCVGSLTSLALDQPDGPYDTLVFLLQQTVWCPLEQPLYLGRAVDTLILFKKR